MGVQRVAIQERFACLCFACRNERSRSIENEMALLQDIVHALCLSQDPLMLEVVPVKNSLFSSGPHAKGRRVLTLRTLPCPTTSSTNQQSLLHSTNVRVSLRFSFLVPYHIVPRPTVFFCRGVSPCRPASGFLVHGPDGQHRGPER